MISRRRFVSTCTAALLAAASCPAAAAPPAAADPLGLVNAIYALAAKGKGDGGGAFIIEKK